jgi:hypothetical protein
MARLPGAIFVSSPGDVPVGALRHGCHGPLPDLEVDGLDRRAFTEVAGGDDHRLRRHDAVVLRVLEHAIDAERGRGGDRHGGVEHEGVATTVRHGDLDS